MKKVFLTLFAFIVVLTVNAQEKADKTNNNGKYSGLVIKVEFKGKGFKDGRKKFKKQYDIGKHEAETIGGVEIPAGYWVYMKEGMPKVVSTTESGANVSVGVGDVIQLGKSMAVTPVMYVWTKASIPKPSNSGSSSGSTTSNKTKGTSINFSTTSTGEFGLLTDKRDAKKYKTVKIGSQWWMAQNLNYEVDKSYCYDKKTENSDIYGRLYPQKIAKTVCPDGWHLPTAKEFNVLSKSVSDNNFALKEAGIGHWAGTNKMSTNKTGFTALPAGYLYGGYSNLGKAANFWTSEGLYYVHMKSENSVMHFETEHNYGHSAFSVRCLKDAGSAFNANHVKTEKSNWATGSPVVKEEPVADKSVKLKVTVKAIGGSRPASNVKVYLFEEKSKCEKGLGNKQMQMTNSKGEAVFTNLKVGIFYYVKAKDGNNITDCTSTMRITDKYENRLKISFY